MNDAEIYARTTRNRLAMADVFDSLSPTQWSARTLCEGWTVRHIAAHMLQPMFFGFGRFFLTALRHRGNTDATVDHLARTLARHEPDELVALLRQHATDRVNPPRVGPMGPFAETCIHLRDAARPLGLAADAPHDDWLTLLTYLTEGHAAPALVSRGRIGGLTLRARDTAWQHGNGPEVRGTLEALAMITAGRRAVLTELEGPGVPTLATRF